MDSENIVQDNGCATLDSNSPAVMRPLWRTKFSSSQLPVAPSSPSPVKRKREAVCPASPPVCSRKGRRLAFEQMGTKFEAAPVSQFLEFDHLHCRTPAPLLTWNSEVCPSTPQKKIRGRNFTVRGGARRRIELDFLADLLPNDLVVRRVDLDIENVQPLPEKSFEEFTSSNFDKVQC